MNPVVDALLAETLRDVTAARRFPTATYRVQFNARFTFRDAERLTGYLHDLGISHCYASPYLQARPGSSHGYDIINHNTLNAEIGTEADYIAWTDALDHAGMGQILDIVPNHMGIVANDNAWWRDVLENGVASPYASYFDIDWTASTRPELHGKVLLPVLGDPYGKALESQELRLEYQAGTFKIAYYDLRFPVTPSSYSLVLGHAVAELLSALDKEAPAMLEFLSILTAVKHLAPRTDPDPVRLAERQREKEVIKRRLEALTDGHDEVRAALETTVRLFNGKLGEAHSFRLLDELLNDQPYRLSSWRVASDEINYRRFFDINELAALSMEREDVFNATHGLILRQLAEGRVDGVRVDHPDGLYDPRQYLRRLQESYLVSRARRLFERRPADQREDWQAVERSLRQQIASAVRAGDNDEVNRPLYVVVEKILMPGERLPDGWPTHGTTGYDFLNVINGLFVDGGAAEPFTRTYRDWVPDERSYAEAVYQSKFFILQSALSSELHMLAHQLDRLAQRDRWSRDFTLNGLRHALRLVVAGFPVYRSYIADEGVGEADRDHIRRAVQQARPHSAGLNNALFGFIRDTLLLKQRPGLLDDAYVYEQRRFAGKFQQVTAPVMAKGMEDTAFYVYNRLISLNEVGGNPGRFGVSAADVHRYLQERRGNWPWALSSSSTHDTKRSEDIRARLNVLSELPGEWEDGLRRWSALNRPLRKDLEDGPAPDANEEYLFYQTLLGAWPLEPYSDDEYARFVERIQAFMQKALHEAKVHSSWINPDTAYDQAVKDFVAGSLDPGVSGTFLNELHPLRRKLAHYGLFNSLSQTLIKIAAPGVPDTYQGTELWDFSLTDPDNRRPVDYALRQRLLAELRERHAAAGQRLPELARELIAKKEDGRVKLYVIWRALMTRRQLPGLFTSGEYLPLHAEGARSEFLFAFARRQDDRCAIVAVPLRLARLVPDLSRLPLGAQVWDDTALILPELPARTLVNAFTGERLALSGPQPQRLLLARVFAQFPIALFIGEP
jgi:(1->4)-alpha-D-glucan 1-alpha-D-glucosylmutase